MAPNVSCVCVFLRVRKGGAFLGGVRKQERGTRSRATLCPRGREKKKRRRTTGTSCSSSAAPATSPSASLMRARRRVMRARSISTKILPSVTACSAFSSATRVPLSGAPLSAKASARRTTCCVACLSWPRRLASSVAFSSRRRHCPAAWHASSTAPHASLLPVMSSASRACFSSPSSASTPACSCAGDALATASAAATSARNLGRSSVDLRCFSSSRASSSMAMLDALNSPTTILSGSLGGKERGGFVMCFLLRSSFARGSEATRRARRAVCDAPCGAVWRAVLAGRRLGWARCRFTTKIEALVTVIVCCSVSAPCFLFRVCFCC